jgi:hypothetical protein
MRRLRDLLTFLAFVGLVGISVTAAVRAWQTGLPPVAEDRREELRHLLAAGRVEDLPAEHQRKLLRQLENELRDGVDWQAELNEIPPKKRGMVANNIAGLASLWLEEKMEEYFSIPDSDERDQFVDREIQRVTNWQTTQSLRTKPTEGSEAEQALAKAVSQRVMSGALTSGPDKKIRLALFLNAVQQRWRDQGLRDFAPLRPMQRE